MRKGEAAMKTRRLMAGVYEVKINGCTFRLEEVRRSEGYSGRPQWNVSEVVNGCAKAPAVPSGSCPVHGYLVDGKPLTEIFADEDNYEYPVKG
jgi:hypothetical protein